MSGQDLTSASLFDVASITFEVNPAELKAPLAFYIPKSESAEEALWWLDLFQTVAEMRGMAARLHQVHALVESSSHGISDGRVSLQFARPYSGIEFRAAGITWPA